MINIDIIHDIVCLQLLQQRSGSLWLQKYLQVPTGLTSWLISYAIDGTAGYIISGSAGGVSPADPHNPINRRFNQTSWRYWDGKEWHNGAIAVKCITHSWLCHWKGIVCINWGQILANSMSPEEYYPSTFKWNKSWLFSFNDNSCYLFFWIFTVKNTSFRQIDNTDDYWSSHSFHAEEACYVGPYWWEGRLWSGNAQKVTTFRS